MKITPTDLIALIVILVVIFGSFANKWNVILLLGLCTLLVISALLEKIL
jgi:hypothetical protein